MNIWKLCLIAFVVFFSFSTASADTAGDWKLVWSDEFDGTNLNDKYWNYDAGGGGWGNNELQFYSVATDCVRVENGNLIIQANRQKLGGYNYSSGRINTKGKKEFLYGKIEARMKLPIGQGIWPAFWMLGADIDQNSWPACGEIDIMELVGGTPEKDRTVYGHIHWNNNGHVYDGNSLNGKTGEKLPEAANINYHTYGIEWDQNKIVWTVDSKEVFTKPFDDSMSAFKKPFYLIMNIAVGGNWPGKPDKKKTILPQTMVVDWVRFYQK